MASRQRLILQLPGHAASRVLPKMMGKDLAAFRNMAGARLNLPSGFSVPGPWGKMPWKSDRGCGRTDGVRRIRALLTCTPPSPKELWLSHRDPTGRSSVAKLASVRGSELGLEVDGAPDLGGTDSLGHENRSKGHNFLWSGSSLYCEAMKERWKDRRRSGRRSFWLPCQDLSNNVIVQVQRAPNHRYLLGCVLSLPRNSCKKIL